MVVNWSVVTRAALLVIAAIVVVRAIYEIARAIHVLAH